MQTVYDLIRAEAALTVTCRNCDRVGKITGQFLRDRCGMYARLDALNWRCVGCGSGTVRLAIGVASLAEPPPHNYRSLL